MAQALKFAFAGAVLAAVCAGSAQAGDGPLAQMHFFEGCWHGVFGGAGAVTDERCFAPMLDEHYVRDTHVVHGGDGAYSGETVYYIDAQSQRLAFTYYASDGGIARGFAEADQHGLTFPPGQWIGADGQSLTMRATWRAEGPNRYVAISEVQENGRWREHLRIVYTRAPERSPPAR
ncbi:MAG: hypothetical protein JSS00_09990 [Proteobacteria bacterium]|nr:hypothetical protein [Pseudomonadota bacterium]